MGVQEKIAAFRSDLRQRDVGGLVQKYITSGDCFTLSQDLYLDLRISIAEQFKIHHTEVLIVGSAKLGFSIVPEKRYRPFGENSDIDVVLCSSVLFDAFWKDVYDYWRRGETWRTLHDFRKYIFRGWMRPDMLPPEKSFARSQDWWEFFRQLTSTGAFGPYKIAGALYKTWHYLESYQEKCIGDCKREEVGVE